MAGSFPRRPARVPVRAGEVPERVMRELPRAGARAAARGGGLLHPPGLLLGRGHALPGAVRAPDSRREAIKEHYHGLMALIHPDRQDADSEHWPPEAAHRVNLAYAVLSDEATRAEYDAGLHKSAAWTASRARRTNFRRPRRPTVRVPVQGKFAAARMRLASPCCTSTARDREPLLPAGLVGQPRSRSDFATLQSATPLELSLRWMRNVLPATDRPRYLAEGGGRAGHAVRSRRKSAAREDTEHCLTPLFAVFVR